MLRNGLEFKFPQWIVNSKLRPREYQDLYEEVKGEDGTPCPEKVSNLLVTSGVRREYLSYIWASANRVTPGVLSEEEFFVVLALVALAQRGAANLNVTMLDKISEPPIPIFSRPGPVYNGQSNLSTQVHKMNVANNVNQDSHSNNAFISQKTFLTQPQISQESTDDEFSDFQSAPAFSQANQVKPILGPGVPGIGLGSPLHLAGTMQYGESGVRSPLVNPGKPVGRGGNKESVVGCRLANYDLGFPTASPRISQQQQRNTPVIQPQVTASSFNVGFPQRPPTSGDNLLIGEEDRYSALRGLTDFVASEPSIFDMADTQNAGCSVQHKILLVSDDVLEVVKTETADSSLDFGEFKSFSSEKEYTAQAPSNGLTNSMNKFTAQKPSNFGFMNPGSMFDSKSVANRRETTFHSHDLQGLGVLVPQPQGQQVSSFSDGEFGDFVSFNSISVTATEPIPASTSPKLIVKPEINKKSSTVSSSGKSKKPPHVVGKVNITRIAKASNILTDSPTFPKPDVNQVTTINDRSLFYEASSVLKDPASFGIDVEDFDFGLCKSPAENSTCDPTKKIDTLEFGAPLKTTLIGNSSDFDDFGDFAAVQHVPTIESSSKNNSLDLLSYSNKSHCPAETQSLASLDLGSYLESSDGKSCGENEASPDPSDGIGFGSYLKDELGDTVPDTICSTMLAEKCFALNVSETEVQPSPMEADKYKCFKEEIENERDRCTIEWSRCLVSCLNLLSNAHSILNSVSSSEVVREIVSTEKGCTYVLNLMEVYLVSCRINQSWKKLGGGMKIKQLNEDITATWESLTPFFLGTPVMENISQVDDWKQNDCSYGDNFKVCGVCLVSSNEEDHETLLDYGGKYYHSSCANLWDFFALWIQQFCYYSNPLSDNASIAKLFKIFITVNYGNFKEISCETLIDTTLLPKYYEIGILKTIS
ncbi:unnamed protein product [Allacma fusca]|uniref:EH domain-containing protein n=1 Tax=Allacma fusca TaxID=39272 RepID=A0A8J2JAP2_9HEXA|nr:unnamed protein product [Allacma fusca]